MWPLAPQSRQAKAFCRLAFATLSGQVLLGRSRIPLQSLQQKLLLLEDAAAFGEELYENGELPDQSLHETYGSEANSIAAGSSEKVLVCLGGRLPDLRHTAAAIVSHLLHPLNASVFIYAPKAASTDAPSLDGLSELYRKATSKSTAHVEFFDEDTALWTALRRLPRNLLDSLRAIEGNWLGGLPANITGGSVRPKYALKGELFTYLQHERCLQFYRDHHSKTDRVVYTRTDFVWQCPHPPLSLLVHGEFGAAWIPDTGWDDYGGLYDNHAVLEGKSVEAFLGSWQQIITGQAVQYLPSGGIWVNPELYLLARLQFAGIPLRRYPQCASRTCTTDSMSSAASAPDNMWAGYGNLPFPCDPGTGARRAYPWEWAAAKAVAECFNAHARALGRQHWTPEALEDCYHMPIPFPEDIGFGYHAAETSPRNPMNSRICRKEAREKFDYFRGLSGASLTENDADKVRWSFLLEQRHECRHDQHKYVYVHLDLLSIPDGIFTKKTLEFLKLFAGDPSFQSFGVCVPSSCSVESASWFVLRYVVRAALDVAVENGISDLSAGIPWELPAIPMDVEDPSSGVAMNLMGNPPVWTVPLHAVRGVDFVLAGFPFAGAHVLYANLAQHAQVAFSAGSHELTETLFSLGHASKVQAHERDLYWGNRRRPGLVFGLYDPDVVSSEADVARLRALHRLQPLKLVIAVRHPLEHLKAMLPFLSTFGDDSNLFQLPHNLLQGELLGARVLPFWPEADLLLVSFGDLARNLRTTMDKVCSFLSLRKFPEEIDLVDTGAVGDFASSLENEGHEQMHTQHGSTREHLAQDLQQELQEYFDEDANSLHGLMHHSVDNSEHFILEQTADEQAAAKFSGVRHRHLQDILLTGMPQKFSTKEKSSACSGLPVLGWRFRCCRAACAEMGIASYAFLPFVSSETCSSVPELSCCEQFRDRHIRVVEFLKAHICARTDCQSQRTAGRLAPLAALFKAPPIFVPPELRKLEPSRVDNLPVHGTLQEELSVADSRDCFRDHVGLERSFCLMNVRSKDTWGCLRELRPDWARTNVWARCCGAVGFVGATAEVAPCPPFKCCFSDGWPVAGGIPEVTDQLVLPIPLWLTCKGAPDERWSLFRHMLADPTVDLAAPRQDLVNLANDLVASKDSPEEQEKLQRIKRCDVPGHCTQIDPGVCFMGYACALYVAALATPMGTDKHHQHRWALRHLLIVGQLPDSSLAMPLWLILDMAGWPISASELVSFALFDRGVQLPQVGPLPRLPPSISQPPAKSCEPKCRKHVARVCLISSHMYAVDPAMALADALGVVSSSKSAVAVQWYGFPEKFFHHHRGSRDIQHLCASQDPPMICGGPGAKGLDELIEIVTIGKATRGRNMMPWRGWPYNVLPEGFGKTGIAGISWPNLIKELARLVSGDLQMSFRDEFIVCGYPTVVCMALHFVLEEISSGSFLLVVLSGVPVEYAAPEGQSGLRANVARLAVHGGRALFCFSRFDEAHLAAAMGLRIPVVHYGARYISAAMAVARAADAGGQEQEERPQGGPQMPEVAPSSRAQGGRQIIMSRVKLSLAKVGAEVVWMMMQDIMHNLVPYRLVTYESQYEYWVLADFIAAVFVPWNWELITYLEWYALGLPIFVPGPDMMVPLILHTLRTYPDVQSNQTYWMNLREEWGHGDSVQRPRATKDHSLWFATWYAQTDYMRAPHVRSFANWADLLAQIVGCDFRAWADARRTANARAHHQATKHYIAVASRALAVSGEEG